MEPGPEERGRAGAGGERLDAVVRQYARLAPRYDARWSHYVSASVEATLERLPGLGGPLLDVGCGTGRLLADLRAREPATDAAGVDASLAMLAVARTRLAEAARLVAAPAERLPFAAATFARVVSTSVLHHLADPAAALGEIRRVLRPGGLLLVTDWCDDYLACRLCDRLLRRVSRAHRRVWGRDDCARLLHEAGFEAVEVERYRISWLWGLMTARALRPGVATAGGGNEVAPRAPVLP